MAGQFLLFISREFTWTGSRGAFFSLLPSSVSLFPSPWPTVAVGFICATAQGIQDSCIFLVAGRSRLRHYSLSVRGRGSEGVQQQGEERWHRGKQGPEPGLNSNRVSSLSAWVASLFGAEPWVKSALHTMSYCSERG